MDTSRHELKDYPSVLDVSEVAEVLNICTKTVYKLIRSGEIPAVRVGKKLRISKKNMYIYLQKPCSF